ELISAAAAESPGPKTDLREHFTAADFLVTRAAVTSNTEKTAKKPWEKRASIWAHARPLTAGLLTRNSKTGSPQGTRTAIPGVNSRCQCGRRPLLPWRHPPAAG